MKFVLYEKSYHKSNFLKEVTSKFNLNVEVLQKDIFEEKNLKLRYYCGKSIQTTANHFKSYS